MKSLLPDATILSNLACNMEADSAFDRGNLFLTLCILEKLFTYVVFFLCCIFSCYNAVSQQLEPPAFGCIQVADVGDATLNWIPPADPGNDFVQYDIYSSTSQAAGYTLVTSTGPLGQNVFIEATTATLTDNIYYYIQTISSDGATTYTSEPSDTLSTIWLNATPSTTGYALLDWNSPFLPGHPVPDGLSYEVWREYPAGSWELVQVMPFGVTNCSYEIVDVCSAFMNFRIQLTLPDNCFFTSNIAGDTFENFAPPAIPIITDISVDHQLNRAVISWEPSASVDTEAYIIYECINGNTFIVDTVWGATSTTFTDLLSGSSVTTGPVSYSIAAFDGCYHGTPPSPNTSALAPCQTSVYVPNIGYAICNNYVVFNWTPYDGWEDGVDDYIIYHALAPDITTPYASLTFSPIDTVSGGVVNYLDTISDYNLYHCYYVVAVGNNTGYHATSNYTRVQTPYPFPPAYLYLGTASVLSQDSSWVAMEIEPSMNIYELDLERYDENGLNWDNVITVESDGTGTISIPDSQLSTDVFSYTYRIITSNFCGDIIDTTNLGKTVLLDGIANEKRLVNTLVWSPYEGWMNGAEKYLVHRTIGEDGTDEVIAEINAGADFFFEDDVSTELFTDGAFCYTIEAIEFNGPYGTHSSFSNTICLTQKPVIWIPNSFVVNGYNNTFRPVISFADFTNYKMIVYSRWGDVIFESIDINEPWDGRMNGKVVQEGTYTYYMTVKDGDGRAYDHTGYVIVLIN